MAFATHARQKPRETGKPNTTLQAYREVRLVSVEMLAGKLPANEPNATELPLTN